MIVLLKCNNYKQTTRMPEIFMETARVKAIPPASYIPLAEAKPF